jgi:hypothetical protein
LFDRPKPTVGCSASGRRRRRRRRRRRYIEDILRINSSYRSLRNSELLIGSNWKHRPTSWPLCAVSANTERSLQASIELSQRREYRQSIDMVFCDGKLLLHDHVTPDTGRLILMTVVWLQYKEWKCALWWTHGPTQQRGGLHSVISRPANWSKCFELTDACTDFDAITKHRTAIVSRPTVGQVYCVGSLNSPRIIDPVFCLHSQWPF